MQVGSLLNERAYVCRATAPEGDSRAVGAGTGSFFRSGKHSKGLFRFNRYQRPSIEIHLAGVRFALGVLMKARLLLLMSLVVLTCLCLFAQQNPNRDTKQEGLAICAHLKLMSQREFQELIAKGQSGDAAAQYQVGLAYKMGMHVSRDDNEATRWFLKSAEQDYPPAEGAYGLWIKESNRAVGERWMLRAAEHGDASTQLWLGVAYEDDWFGTVDNELALKWYRKAAESGEPDAQVVLGEKYEDGEGVEQNYELAAKWYRKAAEHVPDLGGAGQGRYRLGRLYMEGHGVPRDYVQAYFWFSLNGPGNRDDAKAHLSTEQIKATDALVKEWNEQHRVSPEVAAAWTIGN
jgi:tetratricopeptide (TPR) repeat protein